MSQAVRGTRKGLSGWSLVSKGAGAVGSWGCGQRRLRRPRSWGWGCRVCSRSDRKLREAHEQWRDGTRCAPNDVLSERTGRRQDPSGKLQTWAGWQWAWREADGVEMCSGRRRHAERVQATGYGLAVPAVGQGTPSDLCSDSCFGAEPSGRSKGSGEGAEGEGSRLGRDGETVREAVAGVLDAPAPQLSRGAWPEREA